MSNISQVANNKLLRTTNQTLTTSFVTLAESGASAENAAVNMTNSNQAYFFYSYTANAGATTPKLWIQFQFTKEGINSSTPDTVWSTEEIEDAYVVGTGESQMQDRTYSSAGTAGTLISKAIPIPVAATWVRVQVKETLGSGSAGVITGYVAFAKV